MLQETDTGCCLQGLCGGCYYQTETPEQELEIKNAYVKKLLDEVGRGEYIYEGILQSPELCGYRNKMEYSFGDCKKDGPLTLGLHQKRSFYNVLDTDCCRIVHEDFNRIVRTTVEYFRKAGLTYMNKRTHRGYLRHLIVRRAVNTGEILVDLVTSSQVPAEEEAILSGFADSLRKLETEGSLEGNLKGVLHTRNNCISDAVRDEGTEILYGTDRIEESILGLKFYIGPFSFFQTNTKSAEVLYKKAREYADDALQKARVAYDLYSGTGTIAQVMAPSVKKVVGVEIVEEAVKAARENASRNGLKNCEFLCGDVLEMLDRIEEKPDMILLDPPREGVNPKALRKIENYGVDTIVYISCNPETLARDLISLQVSGYRLVKATAVNQFPRTKHVETCVLLTRTSKA